MPIAINQGETVKLDSTQTQAIEETKSRLLNLEGEISIANKNLKVLKGEIEKSIKEKVYQNELLQTVSAQVLQAQAKFTEITEANVKAAYSVSEINQETAKKTDILNAMESEFRKREDSIADKEADLISREASVEMREEDVKSAERILQIRQARIRDFAETI